MSTPQELAERIDTLESRFAFQEDTIGKLNDVIVDQQTRLAQLEKTIRSLLERAAEQENAAGLDEPDDAPPPHY